MREMSNFVPVQENEIKQLYYSAEDVAKMCGICRATVHNMVKRGEMPPPTKFGRSARWHIDLFIKRVQSNVLSAPAQRP